MVNAQCEDKSTDGWTEGKDRLSDLIFHSKRKKKFELEGSDPTTCKKLESMKIELRQTGC